MKISVIEYDQASGYQGTHLLAEKFAAGWETLVPLRYFACCGRYHTVLYQPV